LIIRAVEGLLPLRRCAGAGLLAGAMGQPRAVPGLDLTIERRALNTIDF